METIELRGSKGIRLVANVDGDPSAPPVLLFHGGGQTRWAWGTTLGALAAKGWRAYSVDLRGHGDSDWAPDGDYSVDAFADEHVSIATLAAPIAGEAEYLDPNVVKVVTRADGLALVTDVNPQFALNIDEATYTTVGGYMLGRLGRRARVGDVIDVDGRKMRVQALDGMRVAKVWLSKPAPKESAAPEQ